MFGAASPSKCQPASTPTMMTSSQYSGNTVSQSALADDLTLSLLPIIMGLFHANLCTKIKYSYKSFPVEHQETKLMLFLMFYFILFLTFSFAHHTRPCFCPSPLLTTQGHVFVLLLCSPHKAMFLSFSFAHHTMPCFCPSPLLTTQGHVFVLLLCSPHKAMFLSFSFAHHTRPCFCPSPLLTT